MIYFSPEKQGSPVYNPYLADAYALGLILLWTLIGNINARTVLIPTLKKQESELMVQNILNEYLDSVDNRHSPINVVVAKLLAPERSRLLPKDVVTFFDSGMLIG